MATSSLLPKEEIDILSRVGDEELESKWIRFNTVLQHSTDIERELASRGHQVVFTPEFHSEFQPLDAVWDWLRNLAAHKRSNAAGYSEAQTEEQKTADASTAPSLLLQTQLRLLDAVKELQHKHDVIGAFIKRSDAKVASYWLREVADPEPSKLQSVASPTAAASSKPKETEFDKQDPSTKSRKAGSAQNRKAENEASKKSGKPRDKQQPEDDKQDDVV